MTIYFNNRCRHDIILNIDNSETILLQSFETKPIVRKDEDVIKVLVKRNCESIKKSSMYHLMIETEYLFSGVSDGELFTITREKIRFSLTAFYDRLFLLATNASYLSETHKVSAEEKIKKLLNKTRLIKLLCTGPLETLTGGFILILLIGILLTFLWGWRFAIIYFPVAYLFLIVVNWLIDRFWIAIGKKAFKMEDEKTEFHNYFDNEFIKNYYNATQRTPFMGEIEID